MFTRIFKKRLTEDKLANRFVNGIIDLVDESFPEIAGIIAEEPLFETKPQLKSSDVDQLLFIVIGGNLKLIPNHFEAYQDMRILDLIYRKFAVALGMELKEVKHLIGAAQNLCSSKNYRSKNVVRGMAIGLFYQLNLIEHQDTFFSNCHSPNPILLKKMTELMEYFVWDWQGYTEKYRVTQ